MKKFDSKLYEVLAEMERFMGKAARYLDESEKGKRFDNIGSAESAAVRRSSMDVTRSLANLRRYE